MRYTITRKIGTGGMAEVFLAVARGPEGIERPNVIKRIRPDLANSAAFVQMFIDEASLSTRLTHPNIVHTYDFGRLDGNYFLAMEHVPGRDLRWVMANRAQQVAFPLPVVAAEIARQACLGLEYAHTLLDPDGAPLNIVHRDVTPSNIMIGFDGTVKLLDFGVARTLDHARRTHTQVGVIKGKVAYLSPEQAHGLEIDRRADLFSLGVVLHELLTWKRLFQRDCDFETLKRVTEVPIPPPSSLNPAVKPELDRIVMRALERNPERRYQTAGEMADDLEGYIAWSPCSASTLRRLMRGVAQDGPAPVFSTDALGASRTIQQLDLTRADETLDAASCIVAASSCAARQAERSWRAPFKSWVGRGSAVLALGLALVVCAPRRSHPAAATEPGATPPAAQPQPMVSISLDSVPQGARVYADPSGAPLGQTPLLLTLGRGRGLVEYAVRGEGYEPAVAKVIPDQDKPVLVILRALPRLARPAAARTREPVGPKTREPLDEQLRAPVPLFPASALEDTPSLKETR